MKKSDPGIVNQGYSSGQPPQSANPQACPPTGFTGTYPQAVLVTGFSSGHQGHFGGQAPGWANPQVCPPTGHPQQGFTGTYPQAVPVMGFSAVHQAGYTGEGVPPNVHGHECEDPGMAFGFTEKSIRLNFIKKVYSILTSQLLITVVFVAVFLFERNINKHLKEHPEFLFVAMLLSLVLLIMIACCPNVRRTTPMNYICLFLFTTTYSFLVAAIAAWYSAQEVMLAAGMTAAITLGLTLFAFQTKYDFTSWGGALFALILVLIVGTIFGLLFPSRILQTALAGFGALLMSFYIIYDTQLMMSGEHKYILTPEEYVFAALNLYLDIINLFIYILRLIGGRN